MPVNRTSAHACCHHQRPRMHCTCSWSPRQLPASSRSVVHRRSIARTSCLRCISTPSQTPTTGRGCSCCACACNACVQQQRAPQRRHMRQRAGRCTALRSTRASTCATAREQRASARRRHEDAPAGSQDARMMNRHRPHPHAKQAPERAAVQSGLQLAPGASALCVQQPPGNTLHGSQQLCSGSNTPPASAMHAATSRPHRCSRCRPPPSQQHLPC